VTLPEIRAVLDAFEARKPIQSRNKQCHPDAWCDDLSPTWNFAGREYRVAPREWWEVEWVDGKALLANNVTPRYASREDALEDMRRSSGAFNLIKVREVLDEGGAK